MIHIYFHKTPIGYKWIPGDRHVVHFFKRLLNIQSVSGIEKVFINLCRGLDELKVPYQCNLPFQKIKPTDKVIVLGDELYQGKEMLKGYQQPNRIIAGIGLMTHPSEWPTLFQEYPIAKYLQHCKWANDLYVPYYGADNCALWPAGVDTEKWKPAIKENSQFDFLVYNKIRWDKDHQFQILRNPIIKQLEENGFSYREIVYGNYQEKDYFNLLKQCRAMLFLCEHETQGFACCEAMAMDVPILAWDPGYCQDPNRFKWDDPIFETTSVPFFEDCCGLTFQDASSFKNQLPIFWQGVQNKIYQPRAYVTENLTLKKSAQLMLELLDGV